ncbi:MAG: terpene cyclase/mutase family protein [Planctomycetes bacterium]|nr:terpene cyclase/mutase family protein [Planctomycetota bacterium]
MSQDQQQDQQFEDQEPQQLVDENGNPIEEAPPEEQQDGGSKKYAGIISWVVSGALHATMLMLMGTIYFLAQDPEQEIPPVRVQNIPPPPEKKEEKPKMERELLDPKVSLDIETKSDNPNPITQLDLPEDQSQREEENDNPVAKGREEAVADSEMGGSGAFMAIGAGGGGAGMFGSRSGGGRKRAVGRGGGSKGSESAVDAALRWFKKHQSPNGMWDAEKYFQNCTEDPKCEPGTLAGHSAEEVNVAMTGYALLCFLGAGYDHKTANKYKPTVKKGIDYLLSVQAPDGLLGKRNYEHPVAVMALAEAYAMTSDPELRKPAQQGVDIIIKRQNQDKTGGYGLGWDYVGPNARNDASVTGWNVMALKSAYAGGLTVGNSMEGSKKWLELAWKANNDGKEGRPDWQKLDPYKDESRFSYCWTTGATEFGKDFGHQNMAPVGMVCAVFLGHRAGDPMLETLANYVMNKQTPKAYPTNTYYMYYNTLGVFQVGGDKWKTWNSVVRDMLVNAQRKGEGCFDGSWNWEGTAFHGNTIGRVLSTAYNTLCLEVYYRYAQVQNQKH